MLSGSGLQRHYTDNERPRWQLHNPRETAALHHEESPESESTAVGTPANGEAIRSDGAWGERETGQPVDQRQAMQDYELLRRELTTLSKTRSRQSGKGERNNLERVQTPESLNKPETRASLAQTNTDVEAAEEAEEEEEDDFELDQFMREGHFEKRKNGRSAKKVGVVFKNL